MTVPSQVRGRRPARPPAAPCGIVIAAAILAGCTAAPSRPAPATEPISIHGSAAAAPGVEARTTTAADTCRIVARSAVEHRLGGRVVREDVTVGALGIPQCSFVLGATNVGGPAVLTVSLDSHGSAAGLRRSRSSHPGARTVGGVGDSAFYVDSLRLLQFVVGHSLVTVRAVTGAPAAPPRRPELLSADLRSLAMDISATL